MKPRLLLHVGHQKTGSSALQSAFALSQEALLRAGIHYPSSPQTSHARDGGITSGNVPTGKLAATAHAARREIPEGGRLLLSNENCFIEYPKDDAPLRQVLEAGFDVRILMFVRDPVDWAVSAYMQQVKRGGSHRGFSGFLRNAVFLERVEAFLGLCDALSIPVTIRNYSRCQDSLLAAMEGMLDVPAGTLAAPPQGRINRSMTRSELYLLQQLNKQLGQTAGKAVADALCETLPEIASEIPALDRTTFRDYRARALPIAERLNARLAADDAYRVPIYREVFQGADPASQTECRFAPEQIDVIAEALKGFIEGDKSGSVMGVLRGASWRRPG